MNYDDFEIVAEPRRRRRFRISEKDRVLLEIFERVSGEDNVINAVELQGLLQTCFRRELGEYKFNEETCRSMLMLYDQDQSGCIEFDEFLRLWTDLKTWHRIFRKYDKDKSNDMNSRELIGALRELDLDVTRKTVVMFVRRFANRNGSINVDDFFQIIAKTKCLTRSFERQWLRSGNIGKNSKARFTLDGYMEAAILA